MVAGSVLSHGHAIAQQSVKQARTPVGLKKQGSMSCRQHWREKGMVEQVQFAVRCCMTFSPGMRQEECGAHTD